MAKLLALQKTHSFAFTAGNSVQIKNKVKIMEFLKSIKPSDSFTLTLSFRSGYPTNLKSITIDRGFYDKIIKLFDESAVNKIIDSYDPIGIASSSKLNIAHGSVNNKIDEF